MLNTRELKSAFRDHSSNEEGSVSILFSIALICILGGIGLAIDYARATSVRVKMQAAIDGAVLAGAQDLAGDPAARAADSFNSNKPATDAGVSAATFTVSGTQVSGVGTATLTTTFMSVLGIRNVGISVMAAAGGRIAGRACILALDPSASQSLLVNGGADVQAPNCEIHVKSTANPAATFDAGTNLTTSKICIQGANIIDNGGNHPTLQKSCTTASDPYAGALPAPSSLACDVYSANFNGGNVSLSPGVYCGGINFNAAPNVTLAPGTYVIKGGDWNVNGGTWMGGGVTFYFADTSRIQFNSAVAATITAPTTGPYAGIAMFEATGLAKSPFVFDDSRGFDMEGLVYLPSRNVTFNGGTSLRTKRMNVVVNTLILDQVQWSIEGSGLPSTGAPGIAFLVR